MPARMCGASRTIGAVYVSVPLSEHGLPLEAFLVDPPIPIDVNALGVSPLGMTLIERQGVYHLLDWIGEDSYPNVCDFLEEVRMLGLSRKISRNTDFAKLTPSSKIILIHRRAYLENAAEYQRLRVRATEVTGFDSDGIEHTRFDLWCPKEIEAHEAGDFEGMCAGLWWEDIEGETLVYRDGIPAKRFVKRTLPCGDYRGWKRPDDVQPVYTPAIFAAFPVTQLDVIRDSMDNSHEDAYERAAMAHVPVWVVDE